MPLYGQPEAWPGRDRNGARPGRPGYPALGEECVRTSFRGGSERASAAASQSATREVTSSGWSRPAATSSDRRPVSVERLAATLTRLWANALGLPAGRENEPGAD